MTLANLTRRYWLASQVLAARMTGLPSHQWAVENLRELTVSEHDRLRCAAAGRLVSVGLTPEEGMTG